MFLVRLFFFILALGTLSGCLETTAPVFTDNDGVTPFRHPTGLFKKEPFSSVPLEGKAHLLEANGSFFLHQPASKYSKAIAVPLPGHKDTYVIQLQLTEELYQYQLVEYRSAGWFRDASFKKFSYDADKLLASRQFDGITEFGSSFKVTDKESLFGFFEFVKRNSDSSISYEIFNLNDDEDREVFARIIVVNELTDLVSLPRRPGDPEPRKTWRITTSVNSNLPAMRAEAVSFERTTSPPELEVYCGVDGFPLLLLDVKAPLRPYEPDAELKILLIDSRFGSSAQNKQVWAFGDSGTFAFEARDPAKPFLQNSVDAVGLFDPRVRGANVTWRGRDILQRLKSTKEFSFVVRYQGGGDVTAKFDTNGFDEVLRRFSAKCGK